MKHRAQRVRDRKDTAAPGRSGLEVRSGALWLSGAIVALLVASVLIPSESAARLGTHTVVVMGWWGVVTASLAYRWWRGPRVGRWQPLDWAMALFQVLVVVSALVMLGQGYARSTLNAAWLWIAAGLLYACVRQWFVGPQAQRALVSALLALATGLSVFGFYQVTYSYPRLSAAYAENPEEALRREGIDPTPGSPARELFENRLASVEPIATFALTNSLAGLLVPSLVLWLFVNSSLSGCPPAGWLRRSGRWLAAGLVLACLILTKSRAAYVAVPVGAVLLWARGGVLRGWFRRPALWAALVAVGGLVALAIGLGGLDREVITEAPKSLWYRWQYWRASVAMIRDHPWFGCGPGNFQTWYTRYKAADASETVADPHNFVLEVAATAGLPAALVLVTAGGVLVIGRRVQVPAVPAVAAHGDRTEGAAAAVRESDMVAGVYGGVLAGFVLAFPAAWAGGLAVDPAVLLLSGPVAAGTLWLLHPWVSAGRLPRRALLAALVGLLVNLLAAGGISYPGVGQQVWWLAAVVVNVQAPPTLTAAVRTRTGVWRTGCLLTAALVLAAACYLTMYRPVLRARQLLLVAQEATTGRQAEQCWVEACDADPWGAEAWELRAELAVRNWMARATDGQVEEFFRCFEQLQQRDRNSSRVWRLGGDWALSMYAATPDPRLASAAIRAYEHALALYPNSGVLHAQLAWACHVLGREDEAWRHAQEARRLDLQMPHAELRLDRQRLVGSRLGARDPVSGGSGDELTAEQLLHQIRKMVGP